MPLTNAQKQARFAARRKAKLERLAVLEGALQKIANSERAAGIYDTLGNAALARKALGDVG